MPFCSSIRSTSIARAGENPELASTNFVTPSPRALATQVPRHAGKIDGYVIHTCGQCRNGHRCGQQSMTKSILCRVTSGPGPHVRARLFGLNILAHRRARKLTERCICLFGELGWENDHLPHRRRPVFAKAIELRMKDGSWQRNVRFWFGVDR